MISEWLNMPDILPNIRVILDRNRPKTDQSGQKRSGIGLTVSVYVPVGNPGSDCFGIFDGFN